MGPRGFSLHVHSRLKQEEALQWRLTRVTARLIHDDVSRNLFLNLENPKTSKVLGRANAGGMCSFTHAGAGAPRRGIRVSEVLEVFVVRFLCRSLMSLCINCSKNMSEREIRAGHGRHGPARSGIHLTLTLSVARPNITKTLKRVATPADDR